MKKARIKVQLFGYKWVEETFNSVKNSFSKMDKV